MRFLGIGRRVEVGERSSVTVTIKSAPAGNRPTYLEMGSNSWPVYRPVSGRHSSDVCLCPCDTHAVSGRVPANSYRTYDVRQGVAHIGRAPGLILDNQDNPYIGRAAGAWPIYGLSRLFKIRPGARPMCAMPCRTSARFAISLRCETPHQVLSPS